jgi:hypothetical protein
MAIEGIVYMRARVCSAPLEVAGKTCVVVDPVDKAGKAIEGAWSFTVPVEWLITLEDMRKAVRR